MAPIEQNAPKDVVERNLALTSEIMRYLFHEPQIFNTFEPCPERRCSGIWFQRFPIMPSNELLGPVWQTYTIAKDGLKIARRKVPSAKTDAETTYLVLSQIVDQIDDG